MLGTLAVRLAAGGNGTGAALRAARTLLPRAFSSLHDAFPTVPRVGLIDEHTTEDAFTTKLDFSAVDALLTDRAQMLAAIDADAKQLGVSREKYLADVYKALRTFVNSNELCDREAILEAVRDVMNTDEGNFSMFLGGRSAGKSLILRNLVEERHKQHKDGTLLINARTYGADLSKGITMALSPADWKEWANALVAMGDSGGDVAGTLFGIPLVGPAVRTVVAPIRTLLKREVEPAALIKKFVHAHNKQGRTPCIIIDEANLALAAETPEEHRQTKAVLELFTQLTKEEKRLNVLLACSEHAEPYRLNELGFNTLNFTHKIFAGEVPPAKMLEQLKKLEVGDNLAGLLVGVYGGHIWTLYQAVNKMSSDPQFTPQKALPSSPTTRVIKCVRDEEAKKEGMEGMRELLHELAQTGFVPLLEDTDPRAERLSKDNLAGAVSARATTVGIPDRLWGNKDFGLVPATQFTRLLIARALNQLE